jgi:hypothetical protein
MPPFFAGGRHAGHERQRLCLDRWSAQGGGPAQGWLPVDPVYGWRAKQRSVHNTYFTLPVLIAMLSNHYGWLYSVRATG